MVELKDDELVFSFPEVHKDAVLRINFQRTLRIPDDGKTHVLPPGLGKFPLVHVDDYAAKVSEAWLRHGGVMLPMYQSEALWLLFSSSFALQREASYPFAVKVAAGKIDAVTGSAWDNALHREPQDYMVIPEQPWLDGFCVSTGVIRQFVAMPLGAGYTAEEQLTNEAEHGGLQIVAYPMTAVEYERRFPILSAEELLRRQQNKPRFSCGRAAMAMGLAPGGMMKQEIYADDYAFPCWDTEHGSRCFVHLANSMMWRSITGKNPPQPPPTAKEYTRHGFPWFDYFSDGKALAGSKILAGLKSVVEMGKARNEVPLPENESVHPTNIVNLRANLGKDQVREASL